MWWRHRIKPSVVDTSWWRCDSKLCEVWCVGLLLNSRSFFITLTPVSQLSWEMLQRLLLVVVIATAVSKKAARRLLNIMIKMTNSLLKSEIMRTIILSTMMMMLIKYNWMLRMTNSVEVGYVLSDHSCLSVCRRSWQVFWYNRATTNIMFLENCRLHTETSAQACYQSWQFSVA